MDIKTSELKVEIERLKEENKSLKQKIEEGCVEKAFNATNGDACFTSKQMCILLLAVANETEKPTPPAKTTMGEVVERITGYNATTVNQNMKGTFSEKDKGIVAAAIESKFQFLATRNYI